VQNEIMRLILRCKDNLSRFIIPNNVLLAYTMKKFEHLSIFLTNWVTYHLCIGWCWLCTT